MKISSSIINKSYFNKFNYKIISINLKMLTNFKRLRASNLQFIASRTFAIDLATNTRDGKSKFKLTINFCLDLNVSISNET